MKKITASIIALLSCMYINAQQAFNNNGNLQIHSGASLTGFGNFTNASSGILVNNGDLYIKGNIINNQASMAAGNGTLYLNGSSTQTISGTDAFKTYNLNTGNSSGITLNSNLSVSGTHTFSNGIITTSATPGYLIYEAGSFYSGSSDSKHINGWVKKLGSSGFTFPVGNGTYLRPIALENLSGSSEFNVKYNASTPNPGQVQLPLQNINTSEYWVINKISGGNAQVHMNWDNGKVDFPDYVLADIAVAWYDGSNWTDQGGSATGDVTTTGDIISNSVSSFGNFAFGSKSYPLPVTFISFTAKRKDNYTDLKWVTADEMNTDHYEVQRSHNPTMFSTIASVPSANLLTRQEYTYKDFDPLQGIAYYRIRCVDKDGKSKQTRIVAVYDNSIQPENIRVLNPASQVIIIHCMEENQQPSPYTLYNAAGAEISKGVLQLKTGMDNVIRLPFRPAHGIYFLSISVYGKVFVHKLLID